MAKPQTFKLKSKQEIGDDESESPKSVRVGTIVDDESEEDSEQSSPEVAKLESATVSGKTADDLVEMTMFDTVDPAPTIGNYRFREHGILVLNRQQNYTVPRYVAEHLRDKRKAAFVG